MFQSLSPLLSPCPPHALASMGHGKDLVLAVMPLHGFLDHAAFTMQVLGAAAAAFAIVATAKARIYGNTLLKTSVVQP